MAYLKLVSNDEKEKKSKEEENEFHPSRLIHHELFNEIFEEIKFIPSLRTLLMLPLLFHFSICFDDRSSPQHWEKRWKFSIFFRNSKFKKSCCKFYGYFED